MRSRWHAIALDSCNCLCLFSPWVSLESALTGGQICATAWLQLRKIIDFLLIFVPKMLLGDALVAYRYSISFATVWFDLDAWGSAGRYIWFLTVDVGIVFLMETSQIEEHRVHHSSADA